MTWILVLITCSEITTANLGQRCAAKTIDGFSSKKECEQLGISAARESDKAVRHEPHTAVCVALGGKVVGT